jgi:hypothetical protein
MKRTIRMAIICAIVILGGCGSFNNSFNVYSGPPPRPIEEIATTPIMEPDDEENIPVIPIAAQPLRTGSTKLPCTTSPWPTAGKFPELPAKAAQEALGDPLALEKVWRKHVDELRAYISERRRLQREARVAFTEKCDTASK